MGKFLCGMLLCFASLSAINIEEMLNKYREENAIPGLSVVVIDKGVSKIYTMGVASPRTKKPVRENTLFELASVTKVFTATAAELEVMNRKIKLNDSIAILIPALKGKGKSDIENVTLEELLTHTSGLPRGAEELTGAPDTPDKILLSLKEWKREEGKKGKYLYSNLGFGLAGYALERISQNSQNSGGNLMAIYSRQIFRPLGMYNTEMEISPKNRSFMAEGVGAKGAPVPAHGPFLLGGGGALKSSAYDMERFLAANMGLRGPKNILEAMQKAQEPRFEVNKNLKMGLGWQNSDLEGFRLVDKNGGIPGFSSYIGFVPEKGVGVVILANKAKVKITEAGRNVLRELLGVQ